MIAVIANYHRYHYHSSLLFSDYYYRIYDKLQIIAIVTS